MRLVANHPCTLEACRLLAAVPRGCKVLQSNILEIERLVIGSGFWRRNPIGDFAALGDRRHQPADEFAILLGRQPFIDPARKYFLWNHLAFDIEMISGILSNVPVKPAAGQVESFRKSFLGEDLVPALQRTLAIF